MNDKPNWQVARLDDIERRGRDIPVREHLGIQAFGINAYTPGEDGTLIDEHDEAGSGQEELYIVLEGKATFEVAGETVDAPPGTLVFVGPESRRKATGEGTVPAVGATPGEAYQGVDWGEAWPFHSESMIAYGEQRYADALDAVRSALEHMPDHAGLHYESKQSDFWTVEPNGKGPKQLTHFKDGTLVLSASYSHDGEWVVHATNGVDENADIFVMRADGTGNRAVTRTEPWDSAPDWGPPGS